MIDENLFSRFVLQTLDNRGENSLRETITETYEKDFANSQAIDPVFMKRVADEIEGYGPIRDLLTNPHITEIMINGGDEIFFEADGRIQKHDLKFVSARTMHSFINRLLYEMQKVGDTRHPLIDGTLRDGSRAHIALPPATIRPHVTIRKHFTRTWSLEDLEAKNMLRPTQRNIVKSWLKEKKNFLIAGPTNSGKTTLLRACLKEVALRERVIILEDTPEIVSSMENHISLKTRWDCDGLLPEITLDTLLRHCLRMRPDRIVIGEIRGPEALTWLDALATGHGGSLCSIHAATPQEALMRLESLVLRAMPRFSLEAVRRLVFHAVHGVICLGNQNGLRFVSQAALISSVESFGYLLTPLS